MDNFIRCLVCYFQRIGFSFLLVKLQRSRTVSGLNEFVIKKINFLGQLLKRIEESNLQRSPRWTEEKFDVIYVGEKRTEE